MIKSVTIAKGIGIVLVVIGHYCPNDSPSYWLYLRSIIYKFHMPLFFIISGYLFGEYTTIQNFNIQLLKKKFNRLIIPFCSTALVAFFIKFFIGQFVKLDFPVTAKSFYRIFITYEGSYFPLLWFVYTLFLIFIFFSILKSIFKSEFLIFFASLILMYFEWPKSMYLRLVFLNLPFFCFGALFLSNYNLDDFNMKSTIRFIALGTFTFILSLLVIKIHFPVQMMLNTMNVILSISGALTTIFFAVILSKIPKINSILYFIGFYSMSIYLFHTFFSSSIRIINSQVIKTQYFVFPAFIAIAAGIVFPLLLEIWFFRKNRFTRKFILGLS